MSNLAPPTPQVIGLIIFLKIIKGFKHRGDLRSIGKVASRNQLLLRILYQIQNGFWVNGELNRFGVRQSISPIVEICP